MKMYPYTMHDSSVSLDKFLEGISNFHTLIKWLSPGQSIFSAFPIAMH